MELPTSPLKFPVKSVRQIKRERPKDLWVPSSTQTKYTNPSYQTPQITRENIPSPKYNHRKRERPGSLMDIPSIRKKYLKDTNYHEYFQIKPNDGWPPPIFSSNHYYTPIPDKSVDIQLQKTSNDTSDDDDEDENDDLSKIPINTGTSTDLSESSWGFSPPPSSQSLSSFVPFQGSSHKLS